MKLIRYCLTNDKSKRINYGVIDNKNDNILYNINNPFKSLKINKNNKIYMKDVSLKIPLNPSKIICLAENFKKKNNKTKIEPLIFIKTSNSLIGNKKKITLPFNVNTWGESELGVVIKKKCKNVSKNISDFILGYISANDITSKNINKRDHHLARSKCIDGYCAINYYVETNFETKNKKIFSYQNDKLLREGNVNQMIWKPFDAITKISKWMTLYPGDLILCGAPPRVRKRMYLKNGSKFTIEIEGMEDLENTFFVDE